jgi:3-phosphoshikimate 1-carboxyvinyltransferase
LLETITEKIIKPARNLSGTLRLPGDKSISHRYAILAGLAEGMSTFANFSTGADPASSLGCVAALPSPEQLEISRHPPPRSTAATPARQCA